jgi:hypothetical protein
MAMDIGSLALELVVDVVRLSIGCKGVRKTFILAVLTFP